MKKGIYYFEKMNEKEKELFKNNLNEDGVVFEDYVGQGFFSAKHFFLGSFVFKSTPEGHDYWMSMIRKIHKLCT